MTHYLSSQKILISCIPLSKVQCTPFWNPKRQGKHLDFWCLGVLELDASSWVFPGMLFWNIWVAQALAQVLGADVATGALWGGLGMSLLFLDVTLEHRGLGKSNQESASGFSRAGIPSQSDTGWWHGVMSSHWCRAEKIPCRITDPIRFSNFTWDFFYQVSIPIANICITCLGIILKKVKK